MKIHSYFKIGKIYTKEIKGNLKKINWEFSFLSVNTHFRRLNLLSTLNGVFSFILLATWHSNFCEIYSNYSQKWRQFWNEWMWKVCILLGTAFGHVSMLLCWRLFLRNMFDSLHSNFLMLLKIFYKRTNNKLHEILLFIQKIIKSLRNWK